MSKEEEDLSPNDKSIRAYIVLLMLHLIHKPKTRSGGHLSPAISNRPQRLASPGLVYFGRIADQMGTSRSLVCVVFYA